MSLIGEIKAFPYSSIPVGWIPCDGRVMPVNGYKELYSAIGNVYGGIPESTFAVPNMAGRTVVGAGQQPGLSEYVVGAVGGTVEETIDLNTLADHDHSVVAKVAGLANVGTYSNLANISIATLASGAVQSIYTSATTPVKSMDSDSILPTTSQELPHENRQPYLPVIFCIAYLGEYPVF